MLAHHANRPGKPMKIIDLSHTMSIHTPGWVGYAGNKMYYAQNLQTVGIVAQRVETSMHSGTHFDGAMHATDGRTGDMASLPLDYLVSHGVVGDHAGDDRKIRRRDSRWRHPDPAHRLAQILRRPEPTGSGALFLLSPGPDARDAGMDAQEKDQMVRHGHRL